MNDKKKTPGQEFQYKPKSVWDQVTDADRKEITSVGDDYRTFLTAAKTERLAVREITRRALDAGFTELDPKRPQKRFFRNYRAKSAALVMMGPDDPSNGLNLIVSHIDSPRLDLKANPVYEDVEFEMLKNHYYGGIKK